LSDTVATTETKSKTVDPEAGAVIATDGGGEPGGTGGGGEPGGTGGGGEEPGGTGGGGEPGDTGGGLTVTKLILVALLLPPAPLTMRLTV